MVFCEEVQSAGTNCSIIPAHCLSFYEQSLYVAEAAQKEMNSLFESVGIEELAVFESTGELVVYEGARFDELKNTAVKFFKDLWEKIKGWFANITKWFKEQQEKTKAKMAEWKKELDAKAAGNRAKFADKVTDDIIDTLDKEKVFFKGNSFKGLDGMIEAFKNGQNDILADIDKDLSKIDLNSEDGKADLKEKVENIMKGLVHKISNVKDVATTADAVKKIKEECCGEEVDVNAAWIKSNREALNKTIKDGYALPEIKKCYNETKVAIDKIIKDLKATKENEAEIIATKIRLYKSAISCYNQCTSAVMDVYRKRYMQHRNIFLFVLVKGNNKKVAEEVKAEEVKDEVKAESTSITTQVDLVSEAFNW